MDAENKVDFDPDWIIDLVKVQEPLRKDIIDALKKCKKGYWNSKAWVYFADKDGPEWQIAENFILNHETKGLIVLDLLKNGKIGGIEFVKEIEY